MWLIDWIKSLFRKKIEINSIDWCLPSPTDFRDVKLGAVMHFAPLPEAYTIPYLLRVSDQSNKPHCVGYACATAKEEKERRERNVIDFDGDWIYQRCKNEDGLPGMPGTFLRMGLKVLQKYGAKPLEQSELEAPEYKIGGYALVELTFNDLKQTIAQNGVVIARTVWSSSGWKSAYIKPPKIGETQSGHAIALIGFNKDYIIFQNSFGEDWGNSGRGYFDKNFLPTEAWAILVDLPNLPIVDKPKYFFANNLWMGLRNDEVKILQDCLKYLGCMSKEVESTGYFGLVTLEAVKVFQQRYSISPVSGYVGPLTRAKLNELFNN